MRSTGCQAQQADLAVVKTIVLKLRGRPFRFGVGVRPLSSPVYLQRVFLHQLNICTRSFIVGSRLVALRTHALFFRAISMDHNVFLAY